MQEEKYEKLITKFEEITRRGWIKGVTEDESSVGLTFENELGKEFDSMYFPDYYGTEIKCTTRYSGYPISLFSFSFDGKYLYQMNLLLQKYGISDHEYPDKKRLIGRLIPFKKIKINDFYFKLAPEFEEDRLYLKVYDENERFLESDAYINFSTIIERVKLKLNTLAVVYASKRIINTEQYFRYYKIIIYKLKTPEIFLDLIARNKITVSIIGRVSRSGTKEGRQRNKNLTFSLPKENIELLFDKIFELDVDNKS